MWSEGEERQGGEVIGIGEGKEKKEGALATKEEERRGNGFGEGKREKGSRRVTATPLGGRGAYRERRGGRRGWGDELTWRRGGEGGCAPSETDGMAEETPRNRGVAVEAVESKPEEEEEEEEEKEETAGSGKGVEAAGVVIGASEEVGGVGGDRNGAMVVENPYDGGGLRCKIKEVERDRFWVTCGASNRGVKEARVMVTWKGRKERSLGKLRGKEENCSIRKLESHRRARRGLE